MLLVTGGAGFIGSNVVAALNDAGRADVAVCDFLGSDGKWRNLAKRQLVDVVPPAQLCELAGWPQARRHHSHGRDFRDDGNRRRPGHRNKFSAFDAAARLVHGERTPFIYASSAATYGDGEEGFVDDASLDALKKLRPLNLYGWSKQLFDLLVVERIKQGAQMPPHWAGLKFFNVFGPNEYHKGAMMSVVAKRFDDIKTAKPVQLFKSHRDGIADGDQRRDFIYVEDVVRVILWLLASGNVNGIFNVGTGKARSFRDLIVAAYGALGISPNIEYIDMPVQIRNSYQYFTQASVDRLQAAGYNGGFTSLEDAVGVYVRNFLDQPDRYR